MGMAKCWAIRRRYRMFYEIETGEIDSSVAAYMYVYVVSHTRLAETFVCGQLWYAVDMF